MFKLRSKSGFTLIELMIVVVIIGILASIAIPQFLRYQLKSKTSEAPRNLGAIRTTEEAFAAKYGKFAVASATPAGTPQSISRPWAPPAGNGFTMLGFATTGRVYYQYGVGPSAFSTGASDYSADSSFDTSGQVQGGVAATPNSDITIAATGDLDADSVLSSFYLNDENSAIVQSPPTSGETIF